MSDVKIRMDITPDEQRILLRGMLEYRNCLMKENKPVEIVDDILHQTVNGKPVKKKWYDHDR